MPPVELLWGFMGILASSLTAFLVARLTGKMNLRAKQIESKSSPYDKLSDRVVHLETQVQRQDERIESLEHERNTARRERDESHTLIVQLLDFIEQHIPVNIRRPFRRPRWLDTEEST